MRFLGRTRELKVLQEAWSAARSGFIPIYGRRRVGKSELIVRFLTGKPGVDWETCMTLNTTWGYSEHDHAWKSTETLLRNLIDIVSKGGNYLLNIGPIGDGTVPAPSVQAMREIGAWMKIYGDSIYATSASPFEKLAWGRCTQKKLADGTTRLYLHVFDWPKDDKLAVALVNGKPLKASLLRDGKRLAFSPDNGGVIIAVPAEAPDKIVSVVVLDQAVK